MAVFEQLSAVTFEEYVEEGRGPCLVIFSRKTCAVCKAVHAKLEALKDDYPTIPFYEADVNQLTSFMMKYRLKGVPQTLFFKKGELKGRISGDASEDDFADQLDALL